MIKLFLGFVGVVLALGVAYSLYLILGELVSSHTEEGEIDG